MKTLPTIYVVIDGGAFVWPIIHDITPVNMNSLDLSVTREKEDALESAASEIEDPDDEDHTDEDDLIDTARESARNALQELSE